MQTIAVVDYGASNLRSVSKALEHVCGKDNRIIVSETAEQLLAADRVVFPGQGAIGQCMDCLQDKALVEVVKECISAKPFLGICLGLQSLMNHSEEDGGTTCLDIIDGNVRRFQAGPEQAHMKIPHMGWNRVVQEKPHPLWKGIESGERFYFVHSYYVDATQASDVAGSCDYLVTFNAALARDNFFATQFHPEKSQRAGIQLLQNFLHWNP